MESTISRRAQSDEPTTDVVFDLLAHSHRRFVLYCLHRRGEAMDVPQLIDSVVGLAETSRVAGSPTHDEVAARLAHSALPHLVDAGVVVHDPEAGVVWPTDAVDAMEPLLGLAAELDFESESALVELCTE